MSDPLVIKVVVKGPLDAKLIRAILGKEMSSKLRFFAPQDQASLATIGRNILVHEGAPVLLVINADTRNTRLAEEVRAMASLAMSGVLPGWPSNNGQWYKVFMFIPEIEVMFFETPAVFEQLLGKPLPDSLVKQGLRDPRHTLLTVLDEANLTYPSLIEGMDDDVADALASGPQATELKTIVESMLEPVLKT